LGTTTLNNIHRYRVNTLVSGRLWGFSCQNNRISCGFVRA